MRIDDYSPYKIHMPITQNVQGVQPVRRTDPSTSPLKPADGSKVTPSKSAPVLNASKNLDMLRSIYDDKQLKKMGIIECQTCANRTYVDGSDDPSVSFKTPTQIDPEESASLVMAHEMEHVVNEQAAAHAEGREVVSQSVTLHSAICPECGVAYVAGGVTKTVTRNKSDYGLSDELVKGVKLDNRA